MTTERVFPPGQDSLIPREAAARRPEWQDGAPIVMGDGQAWTLPRPSVRVVEQPDLHLQWLLGNTPAPEIGEWYASLPGPDAPEPSLAEKIAIHTTLAIALLIRNYDLNPAVTARRKDRGPPVVTSGPQSSRKGVEREQQTHATTENRSSVDGQAREMHRSPRPGDARSACRGRGNASVRPLGVGGRVHS
jgi:hypothetical protein